MSYAEKTARDYCKFIGVDPDEIVWGYYMEGHIREKVECKRWRWYQGAKCG